MQLPLFLPTPKTTMGKTTMPSSLSSLRTNSIRCPNTKNYFHPLKEKIQPQQRNVHKYINNYIWVLPGPDTVESLCCSELCQGAEPTSHCSPQAGRHRTSSPLAPPQSSQVAEQKRKHRLENQLLALDIEFQ